MTIRNLGDFERSMWDWAILNGCFGDTKISPTDIDGFVERHGHFLLLEAKRPGITIPKAQEIIFKHLCAIGCFTVIVLWGEPGTVQKLRVMNQQDTREIPVATNDDFRTEVSVWFKMANGSWFSPKGMQEVGARGAI